MFNKCHTCRNSAAKQRCFVCMRHIPFKYEWIYKNSMLIIKVVMNNEAIVFIDSYPSTGSI